jgi:SAM-dependent methyltransferase
MELLACPLCHGDLSLKATASDGEEVMEGRLECLRCRQEYPLTAGVPCLGPPDLEAEQGKTADAFSYEWGRFVEMHPEYEDQFLDWIHPLQRDYFKGKLVLDAGCGMGRHTYFAARYGAREVVGMDLSSAVDSAFRTLAGIPNAHVVQGDIYRPPFKLGPRGGDFDFVYSIGVLDHLPDPRAGFESLLRFLKPDGTIFGWVYGHENNPVVHLFINPVRRVTARVPQGATLAFSWLLTGVLQAIVTGVYRPLEGSAIWRHLPSHAYLTTLSRFSFRQNYNIVFDQLVAPTAHYLRREAFEAWFAESGLQDIEISWRNQNSWRGRGRRPAPASEQATASGSRQSQW